MNIKMLSENIKLYRKSKGMSQNALAKALSISPQSVSKWECGQSLPDIEKLCMISEVLGVSLDILLSCTLDNKKVMIGIDGGGTKTEFIMFTEDGNILDRYTAGPCNPNSVGIENCTELLRKGINTLMVGHPGVCGIYVGAAGFLLGGNAKEIRNRLKRYYPHIRIDCATDMLNTVACVPDSESCISVICGTGSVVLVKEGEKLTRLGGFGYLLSNGGSGYDIGRDALYYTACDMDGICKAQIIRELVEKRVGTSVSDIIDKVYKNDRSYIASFSTVVFEAYERGDKKASEILHFNAAAIAETINHAAQNFDCGNKLIISGGILTQNPAYVEILKEYISPCLEVVMPRHSQVLGACIICAGNCGVSTAGLVEKLARQY